MSDFTYGASNRASLTVGCHGYCQRVHFLPEGFDTHCFCKISQVNRGAEQIPSHHVNKQFYVAALWLWSDFTPYKNLSMTMFFTKTSLTGQKEKEKNDVTFHIHKI